MAPPGEVRAARKVVAADFFVDGVDGGDRGTAAGRRSFAPCRDDVAAAVALHRSCGAAKLLAAASMGPRIVRGECAELPPTRPDGSISLASTPTTTTDW